jgi:propanol-preferring alcohol dehydrogenase
MGMRPIVVDTGDAKRKVAMEMGAEAFVEFKEAVGGDAAKGVIQIADGVGAYGVFVTAPAAYNICVDFIGGRVGAVIKCTDLPSATTNMLGTDPCEYIYKNLGIMGSLVGVEVILRLRWTLLEGVCSGKSARSGPRSIARGR